MKVLVTGGAGFIGSHVADTLIGAGHTVHLLDNLTSGKRSNIPRTAILHELDVRAPETAELMRRERYDALVHHAAQMDVRRSVADPLFDANVNILGLINLMEAGRQSGLGKVVFASTGGAIYGEPESGPQPENYPQQPVSPYGITKLTSEKYLAFYEHQYGIPYMALRYGNVYGPRQNPHGEAGVVAIFAQRILDGTSVTINGDGRQTRDYVYVSDVARANLAALACDAPSTALNIGTGVETDVLAVYEGLSNALGLSVRVRHAPAKPGEQKRSILDCTAAKQVLNWTPEVAVPQGLALTGHWFSSNWSP